MSRTALNNRLAGDFIETVAHEIRKHGGGYNDVLVVLENVILATMLVGVKSHRANAQCAVDLADMAMVKALERFAREMNK